MVLAALVKGFDREDIQSLDGIAPEFYAIGDCQEPKLIVDAVADGARIGRAI